LRTGSDLVVAAAWAGVEAEHAETITEAVLGCLRQLVPEDVAHVATVLPSDLRQFWDSSSQSGRCPPRERDAKSFAGSLGAALAEDGEI